MRILVTGAAGFIGWNLTRELRWRHPDADIVGVDNLSTGVRRSQEYFTRLVETDIAGWCGDFLYDHIYHLASPATPRAYQTRPLQCIRSNVEGLWHCLVHHLMPGGSCLVASSSEVYGDMQGVLPEHASGLVRTTSPRACYAESKRMCETIAIDWMRVNRRERVRIARIFNCYGPGMTNADGRCMSNFIWDGMHGQPLTVYGDGTQTRCFTYVDNVVQALVRLMEEAGEFCGPVNIGTDVETSVREMVCAVLAQTSRWRLSRGMSDGIVAPEYLPPVAGDPPSRSPDLTLAREHLGWNTHRLIQHWGDTGGIARTVRHMAEEYWDDEAAADDAPATEAQAAGDALGTPRLDG